VVLQVVLVVVLVVAAGLLAGLVWSQVWDAPVGVVQQGRWGTDETGLRAQFSGVGYYVVVALGAGLLCGVLSGLLLARWEVLTLVVLVASAVGAGLLMRHVGIDRGPPDPDTLAAGAPDGTRLPGSLELPGRGPLVAFPLGAVLGYALLLLAVPARRARGRHDDDLGDPDGSDGPGDHLGDGAGGSGALGQTTPGSGFPHRPPG
jgi:hypothetical protein